MTVLAAIDDNHADDHVDDQINTCLSLEKPISFFLFAGAGSGKTRSLVEALRKLLERSGKHLRLHGQCVGVITYTNKACNEIKQRIDFNNLIEVSTIHSFVWSLISGFNTDIKAWLTVNLQTEIETLKAQQLKGKAGKASLDRAKSIESKTKRLASLGEIKSFTYSPTGDNRGRDSLNHTEVIKIGADFLSNKPTMQALLVSKFPVLLIDESQDTNKLLMEAFLKVQTLHAKNFALGLLGDTMQRIYADGKSDLGINLPPDWAKPAKLMNHRCPPRIVKLINKIRSTVDNQVQKARTDKAEGHLRLFILPDNIENKQNVEQEIAQLMATYTGDSLWVGADADVKTLILEHHMAAKRMGFLRMYEPLYKDDILKIGLLDGTLAGLRLFSEFVLPIIEAKRNNDAFAIASIVRKHSPLLNKINLKNAGDKQVSQIEKARDAVDKLWKLWDDNAEPNFIDVLRSIAQTGLFEIPESLKPIAARTETEQQAVDKEMAEGIEPEEDDTNHALNSWDKFLITPFSQIKPYVTYITEQASFDTHQGVKGLEFQRVMVIIDDTEAKGFMFGYEKLFGAKEKSKTDLDHEKQGNETGIDRTRRLLYVTCSRAEKSLAILVYSENPQKIYDYVINQGWFVSAEIEKKKDIFAASTK